MRIIVYSETNASNIAQNLGKAEYSYYFVLQKYRPILEQLGELVVVTDPASEVDTLYDAALAQGDSAVFMSFSPPHRTAVGLRCPTVCILAWEFSTIPNETWDDNLLNDWVYAINLLGRIITISDYSTAVIRSQAADGVAVTTIPAPVSVMPGSRDNLAQARSPAPAGSVRVLEVAATVVDTAELIIENDIVRSRADGTVGLNMEDLPDWDGNDIELSFRRDGPHGKPYSDVVGFYDAEDWGCWSRTTQPWIILPARLEGDFQLRIWLVGFRDNHQRRIDLSIGNCSRSIVLSDQLQEYCLDFSGVENGSSLRFSNVLVGYTVATKDFRAFGLGVAQLQISAAAGRADAAHVPALPPRRRSRTDVTTRLQLDGLVYTTMFNPSDGRKNWEDIVTAFCFAFRDDPRRTLILKITHTTTASFLGRLLVLFSQLNPFQCRVIALQGYLSNSQMATLLYSSDYVVNASSAEGQCLPLLEFMAGGIPAIAPDHTAMASYITPENAFVVASAQAVTSWPQDPRSRARTLMYRIEWSSLRDAFEQSAALAEQSPAGYAKMSGNAAATVAGGFSPAVIAGRLRAYLKQFEHRD